MLPKIVWMLWFQGWDVVPPIVEACRASWLRHNPTWEFRFLSDANLRDNVQLPALYERMRATGLSLEMPSNVVRTVLLAEQGGIWADATTYCLRPLDDWIEAATSSSFFAFARPKADRMLSNWFLAATHDSYIPGVWLDRIEKYWEGRSDRDKYHWHHQLFADAYESDPRFRAIWDDTATLPADGPHSFVPYHIQLAGSVHPSHRLIVETAQYPLLKLTHKIAPGFPGSAYQWLCDREK